MKLWEKYERPASVSEALEALTKGPGPAIPIAGGTDLMLDLQQGHRAPVHTLVDLTCVQEMIALELRGEELFIGAAIPLNRIVQDPLVQTHGQALVEAADLVGGPQVRNMATLGGNAAHALPAADGTIALAALEAQVEVASLSERRRVRFIELFAGPGKSILKTGEELIVGFYLPRVMPGQASCFKRIMRPQGVALPILNAAVWIQREEDRISDIRIAVGPGGPTPFRAAQAEEYLRAQTYGDASTGAALQAVLAGARFRSSPLRASADYRRHLIAGLFRDTLHEAWERTFQD